MATCRSVCVVCDLQHQTTQSTYWCIECEEPLCSDCKAHHNVLKATRNHKTIPISDYQLLPTVVIDIQQHCVYHNEKYQLYCSKHERPICNKCAKDHGKCGQILPLDMIVKDFKTSQSSVDLEQSLDDLFTNIIKIREDRESNIESLTDQKKKIAAEVCHLKKQVIQHLNKLEEDFIKELEQIEFNCCDPIRAIVSSLQDKAKEINQFKSEIKNTKNMKKYASNLQTFLSLRKIQKKTTEYEQDLQYCNENEYNETINIESKIDTKIQDILTVDIFGSINVKKSPSTKFDLQRRQGRQAQIVLHKQIKLINDVKLKFKRKLNTASIYSVGCCVTNKGEFLFTDNEYNNEKVTAINFKGKVQYSIPLKKTCTACDVAYVDDSTVAVTTGYAFQKCGISIVDLTKKKEITFTDLNNQPYGITYDGKSLICCVDGEDLNLISCTNYSITTIPNTASSWYSYVSTHADKIFFTNPDEETVTCCLYSGALVWEFKDERVIKSPQGITVDNNGIIFVVGNHSCNVVVISPDGKQCKQILTREDGLDGPTAICVDKVRNLLFVTNANRFAYMYDVSYVDIR